MATAAADTPTGQSIGDCAVCLDDIFWSQDVQATPCGHLFHGSCIVGCIEGEIVGRCPKCRTRCRTDQLVRLFGDDPITQTAPPTRRRVRESFASDMQSHLDALASQLEERDAIVQVLTQEKQDLVSSKEALEQQVATEIESKEELQRSVAQETEAKESLQQLLAHESEEKEKFEGLYRRCFTENTGFKFEVSGLKLSSARLSAELDDLKKKYADLLKSRSEDSEKMRKLQGIARSASALQEKLEAEIKQKDDEITQLRERVSRLSKSRKEIQEKLDTETKQKDEEIAHLTERVSRLTKSRKQIHEKLQAEIKQKDDEITQLKEEVSRPSESPKDLQEKLQTENSQLKEKVSRLLKAKKEMDEKFQREIKQKDDEIAQLKDEVSRLVKSQKEEGNEKKRKGAAAASLSEDEFDVSPVKLGPGPVPLKKSRGTVALDIAEISSDDDETFIVSSLKKDKETVSKQSFVKPKIAPRLLSAPKTPKDDPDIIGISDDEDEGKEWEKTRRPAPPVACPSPVPVKRTTIMNT